jgi:hypothetical protein
LSPAAWTKSYIGDDEMWQKYGDTRGFRCCDNGTFRASHRRCRAWNQSSPRGPRSWPLRTSATSSAKLWTYRAPSLWPGKSPGRGINRCGLDYRKVDLIGCQVAVFWCCFGVFKEPTLQYSPVAIPRRVRIIVDGVAYAPHRCGARGFGCLCAFKLTVQHMCKAMKALR